MAAMGFNCLISYISDSDDDDLPDIRRIDDRAPIEAPHHDPFVTIVKPIKCPMETSSPLSPPKPPRLPDVPQKPPRPRVPTNPLSMYIKPSFRPLMNLDQS